MSTDDAFVNQHREREREQEGTEMTTFKFPEFEPSSFAVAETSYVEAIKALEAKDLKTAEQKFTLALEQLAKSNFYSTYYKFNRNFLEGVIRLYLAEIYSEQQKIEEFKSSRKAARDTLEQVSALYPLWKDLPPKVDRDEVSFRLCVDCPHLFASRNLKKLIIFISCSEVIFKNCCQTSMIIDMAVIAISMISMKIGKIATTTRKEREMRCFHY